MKKEREILRLNDWKRKIEGRSRKSEVGSQKSEE
jgi:hypothetical protein